jgi:hypothetical protein
MLKEKNVSTDDWVYHVVHKMEFVQKYLTKDAHKK